MSDPSTPSSPPTSRRTALPLGGIVLIVVGAVFLLRNFGIHLTHHWWAALILIPASAALVSAVRFYREDGRLSGRAMGAGLGGMAMLLVGLGLLLGINMSLVWPVILIGAGLGIVAQAYWPESQR